MIKSTMNLDGRGKMFQAGLYKRAEDIHYMYTNYKGFFSLFGLSWLGVAGCPS